MGTPWRAQGVRTSIVHRYGTVERPVEPRRVPSCQISVPTETCRNPIWPDRTRRALTDHSTVPYQCTTDIRTDTGPYGTLTYPDGTKNRTQPIPSSLTLDWVQQRATRNAGARPPPLLSHAPRDGITACDQVLHSDKRLVVDIQRWNITREQ